LTLARVERCRVQVGAADHEAHRLIRRGLVSPGLQRGQAQGRPVDVALDSQGALLVTDDVGNKVWRVSAKP